MLIYQRVDPFFEPQNVPRFRLLQAMSQIEIFQFNGLHGI